MWQTAIVKRRLKEGKTYEDFRKAWYHTVGFGAANRMLTMINVADPREIIVVGMNETSVEQLKNLFDIDLEVRQASPLDDIIEPEIDRAIGILVAEDDFSAAGAVEYRPPMINGKETDMAAVDRDLEKSRKIVAEFRAKYHK